MGLKGSRFAIGRDPQCQLRLSSPRVSKIHAAIERRRDGIFLLDFGSSNGTVLNGRTVRGDVTLLNDGDRIQIGPMVATVSVGKPLTDSGPAHGMIAQWLKRDESDTAHGLTETDVPTHVGTDHTADRLITHDLIQNVLVVAPKLTELESDESIELLRCYLHDLFEQSATRQVVVNLECVRHLGAQAIGVLLAHHLKLDRAGGALRICQAHARLMAVLHQVRLTVLVEFFATLDEAVLAAWPEMPGAGGPK